MTKREQLDELYGQLSVIMEKEQEAFRESDIIREQGNEAVAEELLRQGRALSVSKNAIMKKIKKLEDK